MDSGGTRNYVCDGSSPASAVLKDGAAVYTPGLSERRGSASKFLHSDALGSTRGITDSTQAVTDAVLYDAFGNTLSRTGTTPTPFGFVGKQQYQSDADSGLQLLGHRYYDPSIGRFLSSDPAKAGTNWYAYCNNNPLGKTDPEGLQATMALKAGSTLLLGDPEPVGKVIGGLIIVVSIGYIGYQYWKSHQDGEQKPDGGGNEQGGNKGNNQGGKAPHPNKGKTVGEILKGKKGSVTRAPMEKGAPSWEEINNMTWEDIVNGAENNDPGMQTYKKLLGDNRFNK